MKANTTSVKARSSVSGSNQKSKQGKNGSSNLHNSKSTREGSSSDGDDSQKNAKLSNSDNSGKEQELEFYNKRRTGLSGLVQSLFAWTCNTKYQVASDKAHHNAFLFILGTTIYLLGVSPGKYFLYWIVFMQLALYSKRFVNYCQYGFQFYMLDFCYLAYATQSLFIMVFPGSRWFYLVAYAVSGLVNVIFVFKNLFVLHDFNKMTSSFVHVIPIIVSWNFHWNIRGTQESKDWGFYDASSIELSFSFILEFYYSFIQYYLCFYCVFYYGGLLIFWRIIKENDYACYLKEQLNNSSTRFYKVNQKYGELAGIAYYWLYHFTNFVGYGCTCMLILFFSYYLHAFYILFFLYVLVNKGSNYYMTRFPQSYPKLLDLIDKHGEKVHVFKMSFSGA